MKIVIDGHNLGLKEPTGIGVYTGNLVANLAQCNHDIYTLYAMSGFGKSFPDNVSFYQNLYNKGESSSSGMLRWLYHGIPYALSQLTNSPLHAEQIPNTAALELSGFTRKLPAPATPLNLPNIYRVAQAWGGLLRRNLSISPPKEYGNMDVLHLTLPLPLSMKGSKKVVTVHDLIPFKLPQSTSINLKHYHNIITACLKDTDIVFAVSQKSKDDLVEIYRFPEEKVHVTYQSNAIPGEYLELTGEKIRPLLEPLGLGYKKYFLFYGAIEPKKNVLRMLQAFSQAHTDCRLVILGKDGWLHEQETLFFKNNDKNNNNNRYTMAQRKIIRLPYSSFPEIMMLLKGARALLFPSLYEGFGLPVLEAMQMGTPVITSNKASLPEIGGDAVHYVDPYSISDIKNAVEYYSGHDDKLQKMSELGLQQAKLFSEESYRERLRTGYEMLFT